MDEVARGLIKKEVEFGGDPLPWKDCVKFKTRMFEESLKVYEELKSDTMVFFDRGIIDTLAYSRLIGSEITKETYEQIVTIYREYGYQIIELPEDSVEKRVDFILSCLKG